MSDLVHKKCVPCEGGVPALTRGEAAGYLRELESWRLSEDGKSIRRELLMKDFRAAIELIKAVAEVAEAEDHHPDLHLTGYRKLAVELSTHAVGGLTENDFILAAKIESLPKALKY
ncbi:MAG: 4a-hydroxytetrahydrobiopterin dehydratase [Elusimicrobia bacterium]|nr:4a-hydroxytetrahydrobiopterin dehydratase [Elusimicrobiota bacterium]